MAKINESDLKARVAKLNQKIDEIAPLIPLALGGLGGYLAGQKNANAAPAPVQDANVAPAPAPVEATPDATKLARLKELLAKAGVSTAPADNTSAYSLMPADGSKPRLKANEGFARDALLEKLRLIESTQLNEDLSAEEYKEMMRLAAELATDFPNNKETQTLLQQAQSLPPKWSDAPAPTEPVVTPTEKPKRTWAKGVLGTGMSGPEVKALQAKLIAAGYLPAGADDGSYGKNTRDAVVALQTDLGVAKDGAYGPATKAAFDAKPDTKKGGTETPPAPVKQEPEPAPAPAPAPVADPKNDAKWMSVNQKNIDSWIAAVKAGSKTIEQVPAPYKFYVQQATAVKESVSYGEDQALARIVSLARF